MASSCMQQRHSDQRNPTGITYVYKLCRLANVQCYSPALSRQFKRQHLFSLYEVEDMLDRFEECAQRQVAPKLWRCRMGAVRSSLFSQA